MSRWHAFRIKERALPPCKESWWATTDRAAFNQKVGERFPAPDTSANYPAHPVTKITQADMEIRAAQDRAEWGRVAAFHTPLWLGQGFQEEEL